MACRLRWIVAMAGLLAMAVGAWSTEISEMGLGELLMEKDAAYVPETTRRPQQQQPRQPKEVRFQLPEIRQGRPVNTGPAARRSPRQELQQQQHQGQSFRRGRSVRPPQQVPTRSHRRELSQPRQHRQQRIEPAPQPRRAHHNRQSSRRQEQERQLARERQRQRAERFAQQYAPPYGDEYDHYGQEYEPEDEYENDYDMYQRYEDEYEEENEQLAPLQSRRIRVQNNVVQHRPKPQQQQPRQRQRRQDWEMNEYGQEEQRGRRAHRAQPVVEDRQARRAQRRARRYAEKPDDDEVYQPRQRRHHRQQQEEYQEIDDEYMPEPEPVQEQRRFRRQKRPSLAQPGPNIRNEQQILEEAMRLLHQGGMGQQRQAVGGGEGASQILEEYNPVMDRKGQDLGAYLEVEDAPAEHKRPHPRARDHDEQRRNPEDAGFLVASPRPKIERRAERAQERTRVRQQETAAQSYDESSGNDGIFVPFPTWMDYFNEVEDLSSGDRVFHCPSGPVRPMSGAKDMFATLAPTGEAQPGAVEAIAKRNPAATRRLP